MPDSLVELAFVSLEGTELFRLDRCGYDREPLSVLKVGNVGRVIPLEYDEDPLSVLKFDMRLSALVDGRDMCESPNVSLVLLISVSLSSRDQLVLLVGS